MKGIFSSPGSTAEKSKEGQYSPVKAIVYGLLVSVVLASLVSMIGSIIFAVLTEVELGSESKSADALANSITFLSINVVLYSLIMYYAGTVVKKYASSKETKFGVIVSTLTFIIYVLLFYGSNSFTEFPVWYNAAVFLAMVSAINYGTKSKT